MTAPRATPLTDPMKAALAAMPFTLTLWGGAPMGMMPGPFTMGTLNALERRGLVTVHKIDAFSFEWRAKGAPSP